MSRMGVIERLGRIASVLSVLGLWEMISHSGLVSPRLMPGLVPIGRALWAIIENGDLAYHASYTLERAAIGFVLAIVAGVPLGALMARSRVFEQTIGPFFSFSYPIPKIALYPIFVFVFGLGAGSKIVLVFLECMYPIAVNSFFGMRAVNPSYVRAAQNMGASPVRLFWRVTVPAAAPEIFAGIRIALPIALVVIILAEMIGESVGLGYYIAYQTASFDYPSALSGVVAVALIGFVSDRLLVFGRTRLIPWESLDRR
jgi:NitT/TauT family transport system permease protein